MTDFMSETVDLEALSQQIADAIGREFSNFDGNDVRADAGDPGMIYVAIRGARRESDLGRALANEMSSTIEQQLAESPRDVEFAISLGAGNDDLLLRIELREV
jgi:hypothetical protein